MLGQEQTKSLKRIARIVAILTLAMTALAPLGMLYLPGLAVPGDAAATAENILAAEGLFRLGIAGGVLVVFIELVLTVMLYLLLKPVDKAFSLVAAFARLGMTTIQGVNLLNQTMVLQVLTGAEALPGFEPGQLHALALLLMNAYETLTLIWGLFFALHLCVLGVLVFKSGYIPRILGILLIVASLCYLIQGLGTILAPAYREIYATIGMLSMVEVAFPLWLLIKGIRERPPATEAA
jgi:hypothetical protein